MLVVPRDGEATLVIPRLEAPRVAEQPGVFDLRAVGRDRRPDGDRRRTRRRARRGRRRRPDVGAVPRRPAAATAPAHPLRARVDVIGRRSATRKDAGRDRRPRRRPAPRSTGSPRELQRRRDPARRPHRGRGVGRHLGRRIIAEGHQTGQLRDRRRRRERGEPAPPAGRPGDPRATRSCSATSAARWTATARDITRCVFTGEPPAEVAEAYAVLHEAQAAGVAAGDGRHAVRGRRPAPPARSSPTPATASTSSTAPATASASRSTRTRTSSRATTCRSRRATPSASSRASTSPGKWGMRLEDIVVATDDGPLSMNHADHALVSLG